MPDVIRLGTSAAGESVCLPLDALTTMIAIIGRRGSGKTTTALVLAEEFIKAGLPVVLLDPLGVHYGLRSSVDGMAPGLPVTILGGSHGDLPLEETAGALIADLVIEQPAAYIIDFSGFESRSAEKRFAADFAERLYRAKSADKSALGLIVDEADTFAPQQAKGEERMLGAFEAIARRGRVRGLGMVAITQRPAVLNKNVLSQCEVMIAHQLTAPQDRDAVQAWAQGNATKEQTSVFLDSLASLQVGEAWIWSPAWLQVFDRMQVRRRETFDSSATPKAGEVKVEPRVLADVDLEQLRKRMADTVARLEADDPKTLRLEIVRLAAQLKIARDEAPADAIQVNALQGEVQELRARNIRLSADLNESKVFTDRISAALGREREAIDAAVAARRQIHEIMLNPIPPKENRNGNTGARDVRRDDSDREADRSPRGDGQAAAAGPAGAARRPDGAGDQRARDSLGQVPVLARPGAVGESPRRAQGSRGPGPDLRQRSADRPRVSGGDTNDMKDEEVEQLIERILDRRGMVMRVEVPAAEIIRHEYQRKAVERVMVEMSNLSIDEREAVRFLLGQEVFCSARRVSVGIQGSDAGSTQQKWRALLDGMTSSGILFKGGTNKSEFKPRIREWVAGELSAHGPTEAEVDEVYQAVLGRIAVA